MTGPTTRELYYGSNAPLPAQIPLQAGPLSMLYEDGTLRHIRLGDVPVLHQIYAAVRDHNWGTAPGEIRNFKLDTQADHFEITFSIHHKQGDIAFVWDARITGEPDGTVTFAFDGEAKSTFKRNRIGFCVLHPMTVAGQSCTIEHVDGTTEAGHFPQLVAPHQPYFDIRTISHEIVPGLTAHVRMDGDSFEMEDQRNWIDASYKTYCTPLDLPFPVEVKAGERISQTITLSLEGSAAQRETGDGPLVFQITEETVPLPALGLEIASHNQPLTDTQAEWLRELHLSHLRVDLRFDGTNAENQLKQAIRQAEAINTSLELAVFLTNNAADELTTLRHMIDELHPPLARISIFHVNEKSTGREWVELAREALREVNAPIGAGTDAFFTELNRGRPPADLLDYVVYSTNPQVHAFDNLSLTETLRGHVPTVETARSFSNGKPIVVGPVTFKMRWNPNATGAPAPTPPGELPSQVDPRQMSLFGAGWTLGSIKYLGESGVHAATYYETTGWRGIMDTEEGSALPEKFPSVAGAVFPMWHVFHVIGSYRDGEILISRSSDPLKVDGLCLRKGNRQVIALANYTDQTQTVEVRGCGDTVAMLLLAEDNAVTAMTHPMESWEPPTALTPNHGSVNVTLKPYAVVFLSMSGDE